MVLKIIGWLSLTHSSYLVYLKTIVDGFILSVPAGIEPGIGAWLSRTLTTELPGGEVLVN